MEIQGGFRPTAEDVVSKLKDEGDFDSLRLKILAKLKENEDLRSRIISEVKQSVALNSDGAENLKPRELSDAIHQEIGTKIMGQVSDELWKIIRSGNDDGMQTEIRGTVESVYNKLVNPPLEEKDHVSTSIDQSSSIKEGNTSPASTCDRPLSADSDPDVPPGFSAPDQTQVMSSKEDKKEEPYQNHKPFSIEEEPHQPIRDDGPPGFAAQVGSDKMFADGCDEDPDVPPGFG